MPYWNQPGVTGSFATSSVISFSASSTVYGVIQGWNLAVVRIGSVGSDAREHRPVALVVAQVVR